MIENKALITGITGQDGTYLARFLLKKGYIVYGLMSDRAGGNNFSNFNKLGISETNINKVRFDELEDVIEDGMEIYNLAAQSSVGFSWQAPNETFEVNVNRYIKLLQFCENKNVKILQASSVEMYGDKGRSLINEETPMSPNNPYALSKFTSHAYGKILRESKDYWITNAILSNHESPIRNSKFVTKKIIEGVRDIKDGKLEYLELGNIEIERDWGFAEEFVEIIYELLQQQSPIDIIVATGKTITLKEFIKKVFQYFGLSNYKQFIKINQDFVRANDIQSVNADISRLKDLGFNPRSIIDNIQELI